MNQHDLREISATLIEFEIKDIVNAKKEEVTQHIFTFLSDEGLVEVKIVNQDYLKDQIKAYGTRSLQEFVEFLKSNSIPLYWNSSETFAGYSMTQGFEKNFFPNKMGQNVTITDVTVNSSSVVFKLEDGTVGVRSFNRELNNEWYFDPQKKMRFIRNLGFDPLNFDMETLVGGKMTYVIATLGKNQYLDPLEVTLPIDNDKSLENTLPIDNDDLEDFDFLKRE